MVEIIQKDNKILRAKAKAVPLEDIKSKEIEAIIQEMKTAMHAQKDGIAIAAPQIGQSLKIFIISGPLLLKTIPEYKGGPEDLVFINPKITKLSKTKTDMEEGCLSVRWLYGKVPRSVKATIEAYDQYGNKFTRGASGLLAQIFQHETDHLEGVIFTDKANEVWEMTEEEIKELQKND